VNVVLAPANSWPGRVVALVGRRPVLVDLLLVAFLVVQACAHAAGSDADGTLGALFAVPLALPLLWRRRYPVAVFATIAAVALVQFVLDVRSTGDLALLVAMYTVALTQPRTIAIAAIGALEAGVLIAALRWSQSSVLEGFVALSAMVIAAVVLGINIRQRRALLGSLHERAARLELERDQQGRLATAAERARIAREMHDIVAHNLTVMIALADGAGYAIQDDPGRSRTAMATASRTGREALSDMRRLLGVLHDDDDDAGAGADGRAPQPGLERLATLIEQVRAAGVPVSYETAGRPRAELAAGTQLAVYRVVQEALTNTLKHGGPGTRVTVSLAYDDASLVVEVADTGAAQPGTDAAEGRGVRGMRERAAVYDGSLAAGPRPEGGWRVRLELPLAP
jgi:signal transduction histidine kinase